TLLLMRMATAAEMEGTLALFADAAFRFMWEIPRKMDDPEIVAASLTEAGLNAAHPVARPKEADVKAQWMATTPPTPQRGACGRPPRSSARKCASARTRSARWKSCCEAREGYVLRVLFLASSDIGVRGQWLGFLLLAPGLFMKLGIALASMIAPQNANSADAID